MPASDLTTAAIRALLAAIDTYRERATGPTRCGYTGKCWRFFDGACRHDHGACGHQIPAAGNWLPVEVAAQALRRAVDADKSVELASEPLADGERRSCDTCAETCHQHSTYWCVEWKLRKTVDKCD